MLKEKEFTCIKESEHLIGLPDTNQIPKTCNQYIIVTDNAIENVQIKEDGLESLDIKFKVKNISLKLIGSILFKVIFYDLNNKVLDEIGHKILDIKPEGIRNVSINYKGSNNRIKRYAIKLIDIKFPISSSVSGEDKIKILKHSIVIGSSFYGRQSGADLSIKNISDFNIARILFKTTFYDIEGNILNTVKHVEYFLKSGHGRAIFIPYPTNDETFENAYSYDICIEKTITTEVERVLLIGHWAMTSNEGEKIRGIVKNISNFKTDIAVVARFFNTYNEIIGIKVLSLTNIETNDIKQFHLLFTPKEGDKVDTFTLELGEISN